MAPLELPPWHYPKTKRISMKNPLFLTSGISCCRCLMVVSLPSLLCDYLRGFCSFFLRGQNHCLHLWPILIPLSLVACPMSCHAHQWNKTSDLTVLPLMPPLLLLERHLQLLPSARCGFRCMSGNNNTHVSRHVKKNRTNTTLLHLLVCTGITQHWLNQHQFIIMIYLWAHPANTLIR